MPDLPKGPFVQSSGTRLISSRKALIVAVVALVVCGLLEVVGPITNSASAASCPVSNLLVPSCGALWGGYISGDAPVAPLEAQIGRQFNVVNSYHDWSNSGSNGQFPDATEKLEIASGHILFFSWDATIYGGSAINWAPIAAGNYDSSVIDPEAARLKALGSTKVFMDFDHEMDGSADASKGTPADYVAAAQHVYNRFVADGVTNVVWVWTVTGSNTAYDAQYYPGDSYVDWIGWDPYNFDGCGHSTTWKDPTTTFGSFYNWIDAGNLGVGAESKPRFLPEYGTDQDSSDPTRAGDWYAAVPGVLQTDFPKIKAVTLFDASSGGTCTTNPDYNFNTLAGFTSAGQDPYVNVWNKGAGVSSTTTTTAPITTTAAPTTSTTIAPTTTTSAVPTTTIASAPPVTVAPPAVSPVNLLNNPSFETWNNGVLPGWSAYGPVTSLTKSTDAYLASASVEVATQANGYAAAGVNAAQLGNSLVPLINSTTAGTTYSGSCYVKADKPITLNIQFHEVQHNWTSVSDPVLTSLKVSSTTNWYPIQVSYTTVGTGNMLPFSIYSTNTSGGGASFQIDDCSLTSTGS